MPGIRFVMVNFFYISTSIFSLSLVAYVSWNLRNFSRCLSEDPNFFCLLWYFSWSWVPVLCSLYLETCTESCFLFQLCGGYPFFVWIEIVCCGLMNGLFNQELSILQIPEGDWVHSYTVELCRRVFILIKGRRSSNSTKFRHWLGSHVMSYQL